MSKAETRFFEGREARLKQEVAHRLHGTPIKLSCVYKREEQKNQYMRGWHSVNHIDIAVLLEQQKTSEKT